MKRLAKQFIHAMEIYGRVKSRQILLNLSDRQLEDAGISKDLLRKGTSHWPWRIEEQTTTTLAELKTLDLSKADTTSATTNIHDQAIADLEAMADRELLDMGISRGQIRHAVRYGIEENAA